MIGVPNLGLNFFGACMMKDEINVCFLAPSLQKSTVLAHFEKLLGLHFLAALPSLSIRAVVAEDVVQRGTRIESILANRKFEANLAKVVQGEFIKIDDTIVIQVSALKFLIYIVLYPLCCLQGILHGPELLCRAD
jgi:hypothetical protein